PPLPLHAALPISRYFTAAPQRRISLSADLRSLWQGRRVPSWLALFAPTIVGTLRSGYDLVRLRGDVFGGVTAAVIALPLALAFGVASGAGAIAGLYGADRKSTRLNSSHVKISYAVFCLKKKKAQRK